jgi:dTDP-glucose 4,6-dehydratase
LVLSLLKKYPIRAVIHFAAESHVDCSIDSPGNFIQTNVLGTFHLLEAVRAYWSDLSRQQQQNFRFLHVSTDEVYGSLLPNDAPFLEATSYQPNNPYSASKAASDHLVRAWHHTYGLPVITTHCSNNYGPYQHPEKLIPCMIQKALAGHSLPIYGDGQQIRDWLHVKDHCQALRQILQSGEVGQTYNIGSRNERKNLEVVQMICASLDMLKPIAKDKSYASQITYIKDRPGHDRRYAINPGKLEGELGWKPIQDFEDGLKATVQWYLNHQEWVDEVNGDSPINGTNKLTKSFER